MSGKADEQSAAPRTWERVTPCQLEMLKSCETGEKWCHSARHIRSMWALKAKGYIETFGGNGYGITQRGRDYLRFGKRKKRGTR